MNQFSLKRQKYLIPEVIRKKRDGHREVTVWIGGKESFMIAGFSSVNQEARLPEERRLRWGCRLEESREDTAARVGREKELTRDR